jgi:hypothetical protein
MTESSSKGLTWGTLLAGVVSALLLVAIGCVKPLASRDGTGPLGSNLQGSSESQSPQQRFVSRESAPRSGDNGPRSSRH